MDSGTLARQLADYDANRKNSVDVLNSAMAQYGVPEIRSRVAGLRTTLTNTENALNNVDPSVTGRTQGSLVTEAQRQKQVANERAPIAQQYGQQQSALSNESADLTDSLNAAKTLADSQINDYNAGRSALQNQLQFAYQREQDSERNDQARRELALKEAAQTAALSAGNGGYNFGGISLPSSPSVPKAQLQQRSDKGFNFQNSAGQAISAAQYSQLTGIPFRTLLQNMANSGDAGAKAALDYVGNDYGYNAAKVGSNANVAGLLNSLLWGVNTVKTSSPASAKSSSSSNGSNFYAGLSTKLGR